MGEKPPATSTPVDPGIETSIARALQDALQKEQAKAASYKEKFTQCQKRTVQLEKKIMRLEVDLLVAKDLSTYDPRTHLYQPQPFKDGVNEMISAGVSGAFVVLDLRAFGEINAIYGHPEGDRVLESAGTAIQQRMRVGKHIYSRRQDLYCRHGGDEFALWLSDVKEEQVLPIINAINADAQELDKRLFFYYGYAMVSADDTFESAYEAADTKLWMHKEKIKEERRREKEALDYEEYLTIKDDPAKLEAFLRRLSRSSI